MFDLIAALLVVTAAFAWANHLWLRLPANIGLLVMGLCSSLLLIGIEFLFPGSHLYDALARALRQIDFYEAVMQGMLAFLLFAGALHVDIGRLRSRAAVVLLLQPSVFFCRASSSARGCGSPPGHLDLSSHSPGHWSSAP